MSVARYSDKTVLRCEYGICPAVFDGGKNYASKVRAAAREAGWSVRPTSGPGARTGPDICPPHARNASPTS